MKRTIAAVAPASVLLAVGIAMVLLEAARKPGWQIALEEYLEKVSQSLETSRVYRTDKAGKPGSFRREMGQAVIEGWMWDSVELPYPPTRVVCVLLEVDGSAGSGPDSAEVLFLAFHADGLWKYGWVVHKGPSSPFTRQAEEDLASIGCDVGVDRWRADRPGIRASGHDFVSRFFAPEVGIDEDPVTGVAHCSLGPYWADQLGKDDLVGHQISPRGGVVRVRVRGERVDILGQGVTVMHGEIVV